MSVVLVADFFDDLGPNQKRNLIISFPETSADTSFLCACVESDKASYALYAWCLARLPITLSTTTGTFAATEPGVQVQYFTVGYHVCCAAKFLECYSPVQVAPRHHSSSLDPRSLVCLPYLDRTCRLLFRTPRYANASLSQRQ